MDETSESQKKKNFKIKTDKNLLSADQSIFNFFSIRLLVYRKNVTEEYYPSVHFSLMGTMGRQCLSPNEVMNTIASRDQSKPIRLSEES